MYVFKLCFDSDIRRLTFDEHPTYEQLAKVTTRLFTSTGLPETWTLKYEDQEKDLISVTSQDELEEAYKFVYGSSPDLTRTKPVMRLHVIAFTRRCVPTASPSTCSPTVEAVVAPSPLSAQLQLQQAEVRPSVVLEDRDWTLPISRVFEERGRMFERRSWDAQREEGGGSGTRSSGSRGTGVGGSSESHPDAHNYQSRFVSNVTVPDGFHVKAGAAFVKTWKVKNSGTVAWPEGTELIFVAGDRLSDVTSVPVPNSVDPQQEVELSVTMTAPKEMGRCVSNWRLCAPGGIRFGQPVWADIMVTTIYDDSESTKEQRKATRVGSRTPTPSALALTAALSGKTLLTPSAPVSCKVEPAKDEEPVVEEAEAEDAKNVDLTKVEKKGE